MKTFVTLGLIADKYVVLKDPSADYTDHRNNLRSLLAAGGKITSGKTSKQVSQAAIVLANAQSIIKRTKFK